MINVRELQRILARCGFYSGALDGDAGEVTKKAVTRVIDTCLDRYPAEATKGPRRRVLALQILLLHNGHSPGALDGYMGHNTENAYDAWAYEVEKGKPETIAARTASALAFDPPQKAALRWPEYKDMEKVYGPVGSNQTKLILPYHMRLAWDVNTTIGRFSCHEKVVAPFTRIFDKTLSHYGLADIKRLGLDMFGGCLNVRKVRGGQAMSIHSWGVAWDMDPANNKLRWNSTRARLAKPEYEEYWRIVESEGAVSLGRARDFDWMHAQFARL